MENLYFTKWKFIGRIAEVHKQEKIRGSQLHKYIKVLGETFCQTNWLIQSKRDRRGRILGWFKANPCQKHPSLNTNSVCRRGLAQTIRKRYDANFLKTEKIVRLALKWKRMHCGRSPYSEKRKLFGLNRLACKTYARTSNSHFIPIIERGYKFRYLCNY